MDRVPFSFSYFTVCVCVCVGGEVAACARARARVCVCVCVYCFSSASLNQMLSTVRTVLTLLPLPFPLNLFVLAGSPSRGGDVTVYVYDINQHSLPTPLYSVLVSISVCMALSTVFHSKNSRNNSPLSHSVFWSYFCLIGSFNSISHKESLP